ncbi:MAG TPA: ThuA domain-containing protein [Bryobacteraceae bacterium]|nr:ThuA domain-containing protein [Bryobacteraceae bacterium]
MSDVSRRSFLAGAAGTAALAGKPMAAQTTGHAPALRVQFTTGSHTVPLNQYAMFDDALFSDLDTWVLPFPHPFTKINDPGGPDVIVMDDWQWANGDVRTVAWPESDQHPFVKYLESGKGVLLLHHAVNTNEQWEWFTHEVSGCITLLDPNSPGKKTESRLKQFPKQTLTPVGDHPILKGVRPFVLPWDEVYPNMILSSRITPLIETDDPDCVNRVVGWIGPYTKSRVVCFEPGHTDLATADPRFLHIVHNMILWAGKKLG